MDITTSPLFDARVLLVDADDNHTFQRRSQFYWSSIHEDPERGDVWMHSIESDIHAVMRKPTEKTWYYKEQRRIEIPSLIGHPAVVSSVLTIEKAGARHAIVSNVFGQTRILCKDGSNMRAVACSVETKEDGFAPNWCSQEMRVDEKRSKGRAVASKMDERFWWLILSEIFGVRIPQNLWMYPWFESAYFGWLIPMVKAEVQLVGGWPFGPHNLVTETCNCGSGVFLHYI